PPEARQAVTRHSTGLTEVSATGTGNALWGDYVRFEDVLVNHNTSTETTLNQGSTFTVTTVTDGDGSSTASGNSVSGDYTRVQFSLGTAVRTETTDNRGLHAEATRTSTFTSSTTTSGDTVKGDFDQTTE